MWASTAAPMGGTPAPKPHRRGSALFNITRFDFCMTPREPAAPSTASRAAQAPVVKPHPSALGLCGAPLCSGAHAEAELSVVRVPKCGGPRCGHCAANELDHSDSAEFSIVPDSQMAGSLTLQRNLQLAKHVIRDVFAELETRCIEERCHYEETGVAPPRQKLNQWAAYTNKARIQRYVTDCVEFLKQNADCRCRPLSQSHMRFYVLLQHFVSEDTMDFYRPEMQRKHQDSFEGRLTNGVNAQLVKDAHRSEFTVDGQTFSLQDRGQDPECKQYEERVAEIARYSEEFLLTLERFLMDYCNRRGLSLLARQRLVQAVTTQMSQAGLANLDRASQCTRYFVGSQGLTQHTAYNLSTLESSEHGETLKLTVYCMKTGFNQYLDKDEVLRMSGVDCPKRCGPRSYLYQYATLNFRPGPLLDSCETTICTLLDALDEAHIEPATTAA